MGIVSSNDAVVKKAGAQILAIGVTGEIMSEDFLPPGCSSFYKTEDYEHVSLSVSLFFPPKGDLRVAYFRIVSGVDKLQRHGHLLSGF
jgi:hypothetical protein